MPKFIKTRMVYYDNNINILNSTNTDTNITINTNIKMTILMVMELLC